MSISSKEWHARWVIFYHKKKTTLPTRWWKGFWGPHLEGEELRNVLYKPEHLLESHWVKSHKGPTIWRYEVTGRKISCIALWLLLFPSHEKSLNFKAEIKVRTPPLPQWPSHQGWILFSSLLLNHYSLSSHTFLDNLMFPSTQFFDKHSLRVSSHVCSLWAAFRWYVLCMQRDSNSLCPLKPQSPKSTSCQGYWWIIQFWASGFGWDSNSAFLMKSLVLLAFNLLLLFGSDFEHCHGYGHGITEQPWLSSPCF